MGKEREGGGGEEEEVRAETRAREGEKGGETGEKEK